jgi:ribosomal subunit interface protein
MERSAALDQFAQEKIGKRVQKLAKEPIHLQATFDFEHDQPKVTVVLKDQDEESLAVSDTGEDMYQVVNKVAAQIDRRLRKRKEKRLARRQGATLKGELSA